MDYYIEIILPDRIIQSVDYQLVINTNDNWYGFIRLQNPNYDIEIGLHTLIFHLHDNIIYKADNTAYFSRLSFAKGKAITLLDIEFTSQGALNPLPTFNRGMKFNKSVTEYKEVTYGLPTILYESV